jgi:hypothetical protein
MDRGTILATARRLTLGSRGRTHGGAVEQHALAARLWSAYLGVDLDAADVALCMALLKVSRIRCGDRREPDHYVDGSAYFGIAGEAATAPTDPA